MLVTTHLLAGAAIGSLFPDPRIGIPLAFASHFALDKIPHSQAAYKPWKVTKSVALLGVLDVVVGFSTLFILNHFIGFSQSVWLVGLASAIPDIDGILYVKSMRGYLKTFLLKKWSKFHEGIQNETPKFVGKTTQLAIVLLSLLVIFGQI